MLVVTSFVVQFLLLAGFAEAGPYFFEDIFDMHEECPADSKEEWSYRGANGPPYWGVNFPTCYGTKQSPVALYSEKAIKDTNLKKLTMQDYDTPVSKAKLENNGHSIKVTPEDDVPRFIVIDGNTFTLRHFHFHWGKDYSKGSEHIVDDLQYAMELHFVHTNENDEIAVVGVLFQEQESPKNALQPIVDRLSELVYKSAETSLDGSLNLNELLPENPASYFRYQGSLTTPGCNEGVTWTVLTKLLTVGNNQMAEFRKLLSAEKGVDSNEACTLSNNFRPVQPLNDRKVYISK